MTPHALDHKLLLVYTALALTGCSHNCGLFEPYILVSLQPSSADAEHAAPLLMLCEPGMGLALAVIEVATEFPSP